MNVSIIACIKQEELYIKEWIDWHLKIGIDHFYLADNNDSDYTPTLQSILEEYIRKGIITIIPFHDIHPILPKAYNTIYMKYGNIYDWYAIIDCDEFIHLPKYNNNIKDFLSEACFNDADIILLHWKCYGDNGLIKYDNRLVQERFTQEVKCKIYEKSIIRKLNPNKRIKIINQHYLTNKNVIRKNCFGKKNTPFSEEEYTVAYIKHYPTKTIEEYLNKIKRGGAKLTPNQKSYRYDLKYFYDYNKHSKEKDDLIKINNYKETKEPNRKLLDRLNICYIVDDNEEQIKMLENSIKSLLLLYNKHPNLFIHIVYIETYNVKLFVKRIELVMNGFNNYEFLFLDKSICSILPFPKNAINSNYLGHNALVRFFVPYIINCGHIYYVDNDILFVEDIYNKLLDVDENILIKIWKSHNKEIKDKSDHINTGFMYINCLLWLEDKTIFNNILNYYIQNKDDIKFMNQDCFDWLITEKYPDKCIVEDDIYINNMNFFPGVEIFHGKGPNKKLYFEKYKEILNYIK